MLDICYNLRDLNAGVMGSHVPFKFTVLTTAQVRKSWWRLLNNYNIPIIVVEKVVTLF